MKIQGKIQRIAMGTGTWALVTDSGETYEIYQGAPKELLVSNLQVKVEWKVREDVMTLAAIGPVLEVISFEAIEA
jgi:hypothetical protein